MLQSDWEVIAEYGNHPEALLAGQILESNGIQSITHSDDCGGAAGGQTFIRGVQLLVRRQDSKRAKEILNIS
jgi:hypothetical protein